MPNVLKAALLALAVLVAPVAALAHTNLYVATTGVDSPRDCTNPAQPCRNLTYAVPKCPMADTCTVNIQDNGNYDGAIDIAYYRIVTIAGNCGSMPSIRPTSAGGNLVTIQDYAIGFVSCVKLVPNGGTVAANLIYCRQLAICDPVDVHFGQATGSHIANDGSRVNTGGTNYVYGTAPYHVMVTNQGYTHEGGNLQVHANITVHWAHVTGGATYDSRGLAVADWAGVTGGKWNLDNGRLYQPGGYAIPGSGTNYSTNYSLVY